MAVHSEYPVILIVGGNDPSGGAGLCADTQALQAHACHAAPVVTAITVQDTTGVRGFSPVDAQLVGEQILCLLADVEIAAVKTGMLASTAIIRTLARCLAEHPGLPLIVDPVMASNRGDALSEHSLIDEYRETLLPRATVLTPNLPEAQALAGLASADTGALARAIADYTSAALLVTGTHDATSESVVNRLYAGNGTLQREWTWERLPGEYHGSGCTLAAALTGLVARGHSIGDAADRAQHFTWQSLAAALRPGHGQAIPNRLARR